MQPGHGQVLRGHNQGCGVGFSALANVMHCKLDFLKIDRTFIGEMLADFSIQVIVNATINLGLDLGVDIICEGIGQSVVLGSLL